MKRCEKRSHDFHFLTAIDRLPRDDPATVKSTVFGELAKTT